MGCGGIGGIIYKVVKIVVVVVATIYGGPLGAAAASALFTLAEGGSFKQALVSGAIAYVGAAAGAAIGKAVTSAAADVGTIAGEAVNASNSAIAAGGTLGDFSTAAGTSVFEPAVTSAAGASIPGSALDVGPVNAVYTPNAGEFINSAGASTADPFAAISNTGTPLIDPNIAAQAGQINPAAELSFQDQQFQEGLSSVNNPIPEPEPGGLIDTVNSGVDAVKSFVDPITGPIQNAADYWNTLADQPIGQVLPKFVAETPAETWAQLLGKGVKSIASYTIGEALNDQMEGLGAALEGEGGIPPGGFEQLSQIHRRAQIALRFKEITDATGNPFATPDQNPEALQQATEEFDAVIAAGLDRRNIALGPNVTQAQFDTSFGQEGIGESILAEEQSNRQTQFGETLDNAFPGDAFKAIDDDIINSIVDERQSSGSQVLSNAEARGNLNPLGGRTANEFISNQRPEAEQSVRQSAQGVGSANQQALFDIRDEGIDAISNFRLGDDAFDPEPFAQRRSDLLGEQQASFSSDVDNAVGNRPLFNPNAAINAGGSEQGLVSGTGGSASLLDSLAAREAASKKNNRSLGSRGSGTF